MSFPSVPPRELFEFWSLSLKNSLVRHFPLVGCVFLGLLCVPSTRGVSGGGSPSGVLRAKGRNEIPVLTNGRSDEVLPPRCPRGDRSVSFGRSCVSGVKESFGSVGPRFIWLQQKVCEEYGKVVVGERLQLSVAGARHDPHGCPGRVRSDAQSSVLRAIDGARRRAHESAIFLSASVHCDRWNSSSRVSKRPVRVAQMGIREPRDEADVLDLASPVFQGRARLFHLSNSPGLGRIAVAKVT